MSLQNDKKKQTLFGGLGLLGLIALKFKGYLFAAWKVVALFKLSWLISPLITIGIYAMFWGWPYALAIVLLLFLHEMGHWLWMKVLGLDPKAPVFIPGIGAYVAMTKLPPDQATHAWVALAGPLVGGVSSAALYTWGVYTSNGWLMAAGSTGFFLNLLQLVPAKPLDGGFVIQAVSRWLLIPGTVFLLFLAFRFQSVLLLVIAGISVLALFHQFRRARESQIAPPPERNLAAMRAFDPTYPSGRPAGSELVGSKESSDQNASGEQTENRAGGLATTESAGAVLSSQPRPVNSPLISSDQMKPASVPQRFVIAAAYLGLAGMLAYLYWLSSNELVSFLPPRH